MLTNVVIKASLGKAEDCNHCILWGNCNIQKCFGAFEEIEDAMPLKRGMAGEFAYFHDASIEQ